ncbi:MAG TPA: DNA translocase FtsK 4TM domain-containing protein [Gemmatimonadaceae bacterium]|nr:DNA translocase FtsK 4TM domain-containing protein [Gemmatimonadaceae bacterium]
MFPSTRNDRSPGSDLIASADSSPGSSALRRELAGIALILFALFLGGALAAQGIAMARSTGDVTASFGWAGKFLAAPLAGFLGWPAAALIPIALAAHALRLFGRLDQRTDRSWMIFLLGFVALLPVGISLGEGGLREATAMSGLWGSFTAFYMLQFAGTAGAWIVLLLSLSALMAATLSWNPIRALVGRKPKPLEATISDEAVEAASSNGQKSRRRKIADLPPEPTPEEMPAIDVSLMDDDEPAEDTRSARAERAKKPKKTKSDVAADHAGRIAAAIDSTEHVEIAADEELPPVELMTPAPPRNRDVGNRELDAMGVKLMDALRTFKVDGDLAGRTTGPVVTQYEIVPATGVKVRQFANLANDLALAMRAPSIRIVAPIPGKGAVGVEVPNPNPEMVAFREMLESNDYKRMPAALPIALGKDLEGRAVIADLAKMPHLLIAGATGSGKSVCVNTLITSLIYRHTPKTLRLLMVDPKMVELSVYNVLPHLRHKVVTDNRDAAAVLKWAVMEMQERYELLAANGARNIQDFNRKVTDGASLHTPKRPDVAFENTEYTGGILPYIVLIIDELADLMMTVQAEVETPLAMLAQKARAIGIHIILATQRPSVNVLTGLIKANFASRIAFRVASQIDSRTILDSMGAEALLGNGDMLFVPPGKSEPSRLQGAFISSEDTERLTKWYADKKAHRKQMAEAQGLFLEESTELDILETIRKKEAEDALGGGEGEDAQEGDRDKLFREAAEVVIQHQQGSTSLLQRRLKVGYGRAARIIDQLQSAGILGPPDGPRPRDVLAGLEDLDRICGPG